jgi:hypothetical protein
MPWAEVFLVLVMCHVAGDFLLQTDEQALHKFAGLRRGARERRALLSHVATYTLAFVPMLVWLADEVSAAGLAAVAVGVALPHLVIDDGLPVVGWMRSVKGTAAEPGTPLFVYVDQSFHLLALFALALLAGV